jgi:GT2 family glycosyltransferase
MYLRLREAGYNFEHLAAVLPGHRDVPRALFERLDRDTERVVAAALGRRGVTADVRCGELPGLVRWVPARPSTAPSVQIVIPTRDRLDLVKRCIGSIEELTSYPNWDIVILDNDSAEEATKNYFAETKYQVVPCPGPFNYAHIVNKGVRECTADYVLTLNNDTIVTSPDWLDQLIGYGTLDDVAVVGARLVGEDGHFDHEGIVSSPFPQHLRTDSNYPHRDHYALATKDMVAVTGAVQLVRRSLWELLGGMDEELRVTMNDVDLCMRAQIDGKYVVLAAGVTLVHHVSSSRGSLDPADDRLRFMRKWDTLGSFSDPFFPESMALYGETMYYRPAITAYL